MRAAFESCTIDTESREVWRHGQPVHLSLKAYELLVRLLEGRPRAMAKDELYQALWPDTIVVEANLPNLIVEIRTALGDSARTPRIIRTVHGFGYAFCADVRTVDADRCPSRPDFWLISGGQEWPLPSGDSTVGRGPDVQVRLEAPSVSRHHARVTIADGIATVEDLGSKNGTTVNGRSISGPKVLEDGDVVIFGAVQARLRQAGADAATETVSLDRGA
jgi:DNA-binding winged helix-turn-helix (wHTH) protein